MTSQFDLTQLRHATDARAAALARRFGDALRAGDGASAERVADDALACGMAPEAVQSLVIAPAMVRIGELWEQRAIGVADEHLATAISQRTLLRLFEVLSAKRVRPRSRQRVLLAAVEGQQHVLGLRMIADVLEGAGFDVLYLGQDVPVDSLREFVLRHQPAVAGLAFGIAADVGCLADALWSIHETAPQTRIMLGGRAVPAALRTSGYPLVATSMEVVDVVDALLAGPDQQRPLAVDLLRSDGPRSTSHGEVQTDAIAAALAHAVDDTSAIAREHIRRVEAYREGGRALAADPGRGSAMYVSMSRLAIAPQRAPELVAAFRARSRLADQADGFVDLQVWQSDRDAGEIVMVSRWRDRESFKAYMKSDEHKVSHGRIDPDLKQDISLRRLEHLHTYDVVSE